MSEKNYDALSAELVRASNHDEVAKAIDRFVGSEKGSRAMDAVIAAGGSMRGFADEVEVGNKDLTGAQLNPLRFSDASAETLYEAMSKRQTALDVLT
jgi:hypothetical protein